MRKQQKLDNLTQSYLMQMLQVLFTEWKYITIKDSGLIKFRNSYILFPWTNVYFITVEGLLKNFEDKLGKPESFDLFGANTQSLVRYYYSKFQQIKFLKNSKACLGDQQGTFSSLLQRRRFRRLSNNTDNLICFLSKK